MSDLLPPNATAQERAISLAVDRNVSTPIRDVWNPDTCPASMLAWLAWAFSVDEWDTSWSEAQKRAYIKRSIEIQKYKGTLGAVQDALSGLFYNARVQEWFKQIPEGDPYTFNILLEADQFGIGQESIKSLMSVIERTKNLRSHLDKIRVSVKTTAGPTLAVCAGMGSEITIGYVKPMLFCNETAICMPEITVFNETAACF